MPRIKTAWQTKWSNSIVWPNNFASNAKPVNCRPSWIFWTATSLQISRSALHQVHISADIHLFLHYWHQVAVFWFQIWNDVLDVCTLLNFIVQLVQHFISLSKSIALNFLRLISRLNTVDFSFRIPKSGFSMTYVSSKLCPWIKQIAKLSKTGHHYHCSTIVKGFQLSQNITSSQPLWQLYHE